MHALRASHAFDGTRFLPGGATVLIEGDRIVGVEPGRAEVPEGVEVVEHAGTVLPGLIDCHTHLVADATPGALERVAVMAPDAIDEVITDSLRAQAKSGVTTVRDLGDKDYCTLRHRRRPGLPRVVAAGPPITSRGGHCHYLGGAVDGDLRAAVADHVERGVDVIKVMASGGFTTPGTDQLGAQFTADELAVLVDAAHGSGLPVVAHAHSLLGIQYALTAGVDGIEHFTGLTADGPRIDDTLLDEVARRGVVVDLTIGNDRSVHSLMRVPPPPLAELLARLRVSNFDEFHQVSIELFSRLRQHGAAVVTGVDSGLAPPKQHGNVWRTVGELVDAGYSVAEALAAATSRAAVACGLGQETGRLAAGYAADLLVVDGDLVRDPSSLGAPRAVLMRGDQVALP